MFLNNASLRFEPNMRITLLVDLNLHVSTAKTFMLTEKMRVVTIWRTPHWPLAIQKMEKCLQLTMMVNIIGIATEILQHFFGESSVRNLIKVRNQYQLSATLGLDPVSRPCKFGWSLAHSYKIIETLSRNSKTLLVWK